MQTIIGFLIVFGVIVTVHEWGHYVWAKRAGVFVVEFAIGIGPKLVQWKRGETLYTIRLLPFGGYVRLAGEEEDIELKPGMNILIQLNDAQQVTAFTLDETATLKEGIPFQVVRADISHKMQLTGYIAHTEQLNTYSVLETATIIDQEGQISSVIPVNRQLQSASLFHRMLINVGGPLNNFLLSIVTFIAVGFLMGGIITNENKLGKIVPQSVAEQAGLKEGDQIVQADAQSITTWTELVTYISQHTGVEVNLTVVSQGEQKNVVLIPESVVLSDGSTIGRMGVHVHRDSSIMAILSFGFIRTWEIAVAVVSSILGLFSKGFSLNDLGGPVALYSLTGQVVQSGFESILLFLGVISVNLGIMNLLPIPGLDGGKLLLNVVEGIRGKRISPEKEGTITLIGAGILLLLMIAVTINDLFRLF